MRRGFSLLELMIVIIILGLLAALVMPNLIGKGEEAKRKLVCVQMKSIMQTLDMFKADQGSYPTTEEGLKALVKNPDPQKYKNYPKDGYFNEGKIPKDSWKNDFIYIYNGSRPDIISLGADGKEGGQNEAADIKYSQCQQ